MDGWGKRGWVGNALDGSSSWSCSFIHAPSAAIQAAAQVGHDWDSQPSPTLGSLGWPGAVQEKYLEPTQKSQVLNLQRASSSEELALKDAGRKELLSCLPVPTNHIPRL